MRGHFGPLNALAFGPDGKRYPVDASPDLFLCSTEAGLVHGTAVCSTLQALLVIFTLNSKSCYPRAE